VTQSEPERVSCGDGELQEPQAVLAAALEAYVAIDDRGRVVGWNPAAEKTFGHSGGHACGRAVEELIIPARYRAAHRAGLARVAAGEPGRVIGRRLRMFALHADGHEFPVEMTLTATAEPSGRVFHAFAHDITAAHRAARFTDLEAAVSRGLAEADSSATATARVAEALVVKMGWPVAELWLVDEDRQLLTCVARHSGPGRRLGRFVIDELKVGMSLPGRVFAEAQPRWIPDLANDAGSLRSAAADEIGLHVAVGVPISAGGHILGALCVYGDRVEDPEDTLVALLAGVAAQLGQYLERRRAEELAVELVRTKDEFLALVTHELRNPLSVITGTAALFDDELDELSSDEQREYLRTIARSAQRLSVLADDLLDLARLESGHLAIRYAPTDLSDIVAAAVPAMAGVAAEKDLTVAVEMSGPLPLHGDPDRLRQVADNLLSNAVKYTPAGGTITVSAARRDGWITWSVADTGIGIPEVERSRLFRRFYRASTALDRRIPGTGLGLVITRTIIERHHGSIALADRDGPGSTFTVRLPVQQPASPSEN
jgi:PAS domain S-box-containing protein